MAEDKTLERQFHEFMLGLYWVVGNESKKQGKPYWAHYYLRQVRNRGGLGTAQHLLSRPDPQDGFGRMGELGLFKYSVEAVVLERRFRPLFTGAELATARRRLAAVGHQVPD